jgi:hypothetical protein
MYYLLSEVDHKTGDRYVVQIKVCPCYEDLANLFVPRLCIHMLL